MAAGWSKSSDFVFGGHSTRSYKPGACLARSRCMGGAGRSTRIWPAPTRSSSAWVYGARGTNFLTTMLRLMRERETIEVVADQIGAPTWSGLLACLWRLVARKQRGIYHYAHAGVASWYDVAAGIAEKALHAGLLERPVAVSPITSDQYPSAAQRPVSRCSIRPRLCKLPILLLGIGGQTCAALYAI